MYALTPGYIVTGSAESPSPLKEAKNIPKLGACNCCIWESQAGGSPQFKASLGYTERFCLKNKSKSK
jgi:hypothetical protein